MYLASVMLKAMNFYFLLMQNIIAGPKLKKHPNVLFL